MMRLVGGQDRGELLGGVGDHGLVHAGVDDLDDLPRRVADGLEADGERASLG